MTENRPFNLMDYLPRYYHDSRVVIDIQGANEAELAKVHRRIYDILDQFYIDTATWGLDVWEEQLGLPTVKGRSYDSRREMVRAKLRGSGTTTKALIKNVAESFSGAEVEVTEYPSEYRFDIKFVGVRGIPANMTGLTDAIEHIKPAHLAFDFVYTFTWWEGISGLTWNDASTRTWDELRTYED